MAAFKILEIQDLHFHSILMSSKKSGCCNFFSMLALVAVIQSQVEIILMFHFSSFFDQLFITISNITKT